LRRLNRKACGETN